jgi:predicted negative regulator of RcsB-dependent stress response
LGRLHIQDGQFEVGEAILDDQSAWAHAYLGSLLLHDHRDQEAEEHFEKAAAIMPDVPLFHCHVGDALVRLDRSADADRAFCRALAPVAHPSSDSRDATRLHITAKLTTGSARRARSVEDELEFQPRRSTRDVDHIRMKQKTEG